MAFTSSLDPHGPYLILGSFWSLLDVSILMVLIRTLDPLADPHLKLRVVGGAGKLRPLLPSGRELMFEYEAATCRPVVPIIYLVRARVSDIIRTSLLRDLHLVDEYSY